MIGKIILIVLKVILFIVQTLGFYFLIHNIPIWIRRRKGSYGTTELYVAHDNSEGLDARIKSRIPMWIGTSLVGKSITIKGKDYLVLGENLEKVNAIHPEKSTVQLNLYRNKKLSFRRVTMDEAKELYRKYSKTGPVKSREIRRDVRNFCNQSCIQDCTECILKKYGKGVKAE